MVMRWLARTQSYSPACGARAEGKGEMKGEADKPKSWGRSIFQFFIGLAALLCFAGAVFKASSNQVASGGLFAGLFAFCSVLFVLPDLESFSAFGIAAKLKSKLQEAEMLTKQIRSVASSQGRVAFYFLGWGNRWRDDRAEEFRLADEMDSALEEIGLDPDELKRIKRPYLNFLKFDLYTAFTDLARTRASHKGITVPAVMAEDLESLRIKPLARCCRAFLEKMAIEDEDKAKLAAFADRIELINEESLKKNSISEEAKQLIETSNFATTFRKVFGEELQK
jgi:hypothetical protein